MVLREFVTSPGIRCFNVGEYNTAFAAINVLEAAIKPTNVVPLPNAESSPE